LAEDRKRGDEVQSSPRICFEDVEIGDAVTGKKWAGDVSVLNKISLRASSRPGGERTIFHIYSWSEKSFLLYKEFFYLVIPIKYALLKHKFVPDQSNNLGIPGRGMFP
jgi:hypothetical protein